MAFVERAINVTVQLNVTKHVVVWCLMAHNHRARRIGVLTARRHQACSTAILDGSELSSALQTVAMQWGAVEYKVGRIVRAQSV